MGFVQVVSINVHVLVLIPFEGQILGPKAVQDHSAGVQVPGGFVCPLFVWVVKAPKLSKAFAMMV